MGRGGCGSGGRDPLTIYRSIFHPTPLLLNSPHNTPVIGEGNKKQNNMKKLSKCSINPIWPRGGHIVPPLSRICVYLCKYAYERIEKNLTFLGYEFGKGQYTFYPLKLSCFAEKKNKVRRKYQNFIRGDPYELGQTPL